MAEPTMPVSIVALDATIFTLAEVIRHFAREDQTMLEDDPDLLGRVVRVFYRLGAIRESAGMEDDEHWLTPNRGKWMQQRAPWKQGALFGRRSHPPVEAVGRSPCRYAYGARVPTVLYWLPAGAEFWARYPRARSCKHEGCLVDSRAAELLDALPNSDRHPWRRG